MRYRELGSTGLRVSEIGFGAWGIGGNAYGDTDDEESKMALLLAVEKGVNFIDTSDIYGAGHSERLIGETLSNVRDKILIATKGGTLPHTGTHMPQDFSSGHIRQALQASLDRLRTDYIDLYQLHSPSLDHLTDELLATLEELKGAGKIRHVGVSLRSPDDGQAILDRYPFATIQVNLNMIDHRAIDNGLLALAKQKHMAVIARTPFNFGFLTGAIKNLNFGNKDHRSNWPREQLERWAKAADLFEPLCDGGSKTNAQVALQFCLSIQEVSTVIPGLQKREQVLENILASELGPFSTAEMSFIRKVYANNTFVNPSIKNKTVKERYSL